MSGQQLIHIVVESTAVLAACQRIMGGLTDIGQLAFFIGSNGMAEHRLKTWRLIDVSGFDGVDNVHQHRTRGMAQIEPEQNDDDCRQRKSPADDGGFMPGDDGKRGIGDPINHKPVRIGERVVVIPGFTFGVEKMPFAAGHFVHQRFAYVLLKERPRVRMQHNGAVTFHDKKLTLNRCHHLAQGIPHGG